ncbi:MAG: hypothetical protein JWL84_2972 [Rhodospirillales bacterium]|jgi:hypothetical protein|nr:hypothetical protein [Rhodospirillales bacterium]
MRSEPDEHAVSLQNLIAVDRLLTEGTRSGCRVIDALGEDRVATGEFTRWTRPSAILVIMSRVAIVSGVLAALEFAV